MPEFRAERTVIRAVPLVGSERVRSTVGTNHRKAEVFDSATSASAARTPSGKNAGKKTPLAEVIGCEKSLRDQLSPKHPASSSFKRMPRHCRPRSRLLLKRGSKFRILDLGPMAETCAIIAFAVLARCTAALPSDAPMMMRPMVQVGDATSACNDVVTDTASLLGACQELVTTRQCTGDCLANFTATFSTCIAPRLGSVDPSSQAALGTIETLCEGAGEPDPGMALRTVFVWQAA
jgi:hypothetical protein